MPSRLHTGMEVDGLHIGERIHSGAMGDIFRIDGGNAGFPCVMKVPRLGADQSSEGLLAFETEVMILPTLAGRHVPRFVRAGDIVHNPYLVLEWLDGESLARRLKRVPLSFEEIARIGAGIADALQWMHMRDTIHFDLKPDNVILRPDGRVFLIDFGLAHHARYPDLLAEERRFTAGSTPYVSPEQVLGSRSDPRSDLFALGVLLYEMTTGESPFGVPASIASLRNRLWLEPKPPRALRAETPPWLQEIILRCLEPHASGRYQSAAHVSFDLRHPGQVALSARARKTSRAGVLGQAKRWWHARNERLVPAHLPHAVVGNAPVIMAAIDTTHPDDPRHPAIRRWLAQVLSLSTDFRLICVAVIPGGPASAAGPHTAHGASMEHQIRLRHWVTPLRLPPHRLSLHVIEAEAPGSALVEFAQSNHVDVIVLGAPGPNQHALAWWRSVASTVTANAHCSVHVVRIAAEEHTPL